MKAYVHQGTTASVSDVAEPQAGAGQVKIRLKIAGLNRRDLKAPKGRGADDPAVILGSDGAGVVEELGSGVTNVRVGDEVIVNPSLGWEANSPALPDGFDVLGIPGDGTFAEKLCVAAEQVEIKPAHLSWEEAGVLTLSALTGYRALFTKGGVKEGDTLFVPGAGSGVATYIVQFAKAAGARVIVSSRSEEKRKKSKAIGADRAIDTHSDWQEALKDERIDVVIDSVGAATFNRSLAVLKRGGRMVTFGATTEDHVTIDLRKFYYGQYQLLGSTMGSREELRALLILMTEHDIRPLVDKAYPLDDAAQAFEYLSQGGQFGKVALRISD